MKKTFLSLMAFSLLALSPMGSDAAHPKKVAQQQLKKN